SSTVAEVIEAAAENVATDASLRIAPGDYVRISVRDRGYGIPARILRIISDPYFTTKTSGSGLGLATAYAIVAKHQGHIGVESEMGAGTTVSIYLPASSQRPEAPVDPLEDLQTGSGRVLVMDDEYLIRKILAKTLERSGYDVECAAD